MAELARLFFNSLLILLGAGLILAGLVGFTPAWAGEPGEPPAMPDWSAVQPVYAEAADRASLTTPAARPETPLRLVIPAIGLDAPVVPAEKNAVKLARRSFQSWEAPEGYLAGWHGDSARLGEAGNLVLNGHHNIDGQVFARLIDLAEGDEILVYGESLVVRYRVAEKVLLPEKDQPRKVRLANARWILPTADTRLTLVTCWPYETNTHRLIIVALPE